MHIRKHIFVRIHKLCSHFEYFECITLSSFYNLWRVGNEAKGRNGGEREREKETNTTCDL